jgi:hypothetical protein
MTNEILHYRSSMAYNEEVFLIQNGDLIKIFMAVDENFDVILKPLGTEHDLRGHSHVSLILLIFLFQRQSRAAFDLFARAQSFQAWLLARPGIECALIIGKWVDDPNNAKIWRDRLKDLKAYRATYEGKALRSKSLANSEAIQGVLKKLNDYFAHVNHTYYDRHKKLIDLNETQVALQIDFNEDSFTQEAHVLAFLHLVLLTQQGLADLCTGLFGHPVSLTTNPKGFRDRVGPRLEKLFKNKPEARKILNEMGNWDAA